MGNSSKKQGSIVAIMAMIFLFAMIAFVTNLCSPMAVILKNAFKVPEALAQVGNYGNFGAYFLMGVPAGLLIDKFGYKKTAIAALVVGIIGLLIQWVSGSMGFVVYLIGAFISGLCMCMLNTVVNPMLNLLGGGGNTGNQLVQAGGTLNSLSATATPVLTGFLVGTLTKDSFPDVAPLIITGIVIFLAAFCIISFIKIKEPQGDLKNVTYERSPLAFRHCLLGIIAIFFYVGIEIATPGMMNQWISREGGFAGAAAVAGSLAGIYWFLMLCGRLTSTIISGKVSTRTQMITVSTVGIILIVAAIFTGDVTTTLNIDLGIIKIENATVPLSCVFIFLCGLCTSIMWGGIFNLSTEGLGKYTAKASGIFMVMVFGGGMMPFFQDLVLVQQLGISYLNSYWLIVAMLAYILFYSIWGCKNVNKDIKVD